MLQATEAPALTTGAATIALAPSFLSSYTTQTDDFTTAAGNLPASGSNPGATDPSVTTLGELPYASHECSINHSQFLSTLLRCWLSLSLVLNCLDEHTTAAENAAFTLFVRVDYPVRGEPLIP